uniref:SAP domain-containing protein n=1 Tax=Gongylonema pulchrum TaxID=637853 RepID=A0A183D6T3_9BILA
LMNELKKKGLVGSTSDLANILNKVSSTSGAKQPVPTASSTANPCATTTTTSYAQLTAQAVPSVQTVSAATFAHGLPVPAVLSSNQFVPAVQQPQQQPLLNGPVPAGVIPTVGVDLTTHTGPCTSEAHSHGVYGRPRKCFLQNCLFFHIFDVKNHAYLRLANQRLHTHVGCA